MCTQLTSAAVQVDGEEHSGVSSLASLPLQIVNSNTVLGVSLLQHLVCGCVDFACFSIASHFSVASAWKHAACQTRGCILQDVASQGECQDAPAAVSGSEHG